MTDLTWGILMFIIIALWIAWVVMNYMWLNWCIKLKYDSSKSKYDSSLGMYYGGTFNVSKKKFLLIKFISKYLLNFTYARRIDNSIIRVENTDLYIYIKIKP